MGSFNCNVRLMKSIIVHNATSAQNTGDLLRVAYTIVVYYFSWPI